jgi:hypothetical protein
MIARSLLRLILRSGPQDRVSKDGAATGFAAMLRDARRAWHGGLLSMRPEYRSNRYAIK